MPLAQSLDQHDNVHLKSVAGTTARWAEEAMASEEWDVIVVGAGSAGCVLANRLTAGGQRVLLLEAGGSDRNQFFHIPAGFTKMLGRPANDWNYSAEPEPYLKDRELTHFKGKVLGGSSSINGLLYVRGHKADYDQWRQMGLEGWDWDSVLPYFRKSENFAGEADDMHAVGGELDVQRPAHRYRSPLMDKLIAASRELGLPATDDYNQPDPEGLAHSQTTMRGRWRCSAATAFLRPALGRKNLEVRTHADVQKILVEDGRAVGLRYLWKGQVQETRAREVILSAGALSSPHLLELSGIGDGQRLQDLGIPVIRHLPGVGDNLVDHLAIPVAFRVKGISSANLDVQGWRLIREIAKFYFAGTGVLTATPGMVTGFARIRPEAASADLQIMARAFTSDPKSKNFRPEKAPGLSSVACPCRPRSRGWIHAVTPNPEDRPKFVMNYLKDPDDRYIAMEGVKLVRRLAEQPSLKPYIAAELVPGASIATDADIMDYVTAAAFSPYHAAGSCRMGVDDRAVVDARLRVHGLPGLRVVDTSVLPNMVSGNTNAPTIMIAEKASDMILQDLRS
jgi:choline dehydrogenase